MRAWALSAGLFWGPLTFAAVVAALVGAGPGFPLAAAWVGPIIACGLLSTVFAPRWRYRFARWEITDEAIYVRRGWFSVETRIVPINRLQQVDVEIGPIMRLFNLAKVSCSTAADGIEIGMLSNDTAREVADNLALKMAANAEDAT